MQHLVAVFEDIGCDSVRTGDELRRALERNPFLHVPGGMGRTKLTTDWFDRRLGTPMTVRNWRTVNALLEMVQAG